MRKFSPDLPQVVYLANTRNGRQVPQWHTSAHGAAQPRSLALQVGRPLQHAAAPHYRSDEVPGPAVLPSDPALQVFQLISAFLAPDFVQTQKESTVASKSTSADWTMEIEG